MKRILVIDDDHDILLLLKNFLVAKGYEIETAYKGAEGEKLLDTFNPDLILCDYRLDDMDGEELLKKIRVKKPGIPVIVITGYPNLRTAVTMVQLGAYDYINKPFSTDAILLTIQQAFDYKPDKGAKKATSPVSDYIFSDSVYSTNLRHQIALVAPTNYSVIIYGESGAGKEGIAKLIHQQSGRADQPFVAMDCGAISRELAGSALFGHEKGAFTGADLQKNGHFEAANGGTLFLDEIGNLPVDVQTLLLRVLQEKSLRRLGSNKEMKIDVRIIVASNEKLSDAVRKGKFREDLYHRLNEFHIEIAPLRERKEDIPFFTTHFMKHILQELKKEALAVDPQVEEILQNYPWPGNVRELKNVLRRSVLVSKNILDVASLPFEVVNYQQIADAIEQNQQAEPLLPGVEETVTAYNPKPIVPEQAFGREQLKKAALDAELEMIMATLAKCNNNKALAAKTLGIDRKTLYNKLNQVGKK